MVAANDRWEMSKSNESVHDFWIHTFDFYLFAIDCKDKFWQLHGFLIIVSILLQAIFFHDPFKIKHCRLTIWLLKFKPPFCHANDGCVICPY